MSFLMLNGSCSNEIYGLVKFNISVYTIDSFNIIL